MNYGDIHIPHDMKCGNCQHNASAHWGSYDGVIVDIICYKCIFDDASSAEKVCLTFKFDNLNYIEKMAERKEQEKNLI